MATVNLVNKDIVGKKTKYLYSKIRTTIETSFYRNNVIKVTNIQKAYDLAKGSNGTVVTDLKVHDPIRIGLKDNTKVLIFNDGTITGRQAKVRRLVHNSNKEKFSKILREAVFNSRNKKLYHATTYVGLHPDFMVKAHLLIPEGYENTLYSWMLNFQTPDMKTTELYSNSTKFEEGDILLYSDPDEFVDKYDTGLSLFDHKNNCGALLGLRYFGEHKKATLTMAWSIAARNGFTACHGGQKRFNLDEKPYIASVFGLSGSGKSTITHSKHKGKFDVTVLHDDAFIISNKDGSSISLEPSYFDKVQDYPTNSNDNKYLLTMQNVGATKDINGDILPVTEDIRNGNGRALKSKLWTPKRAYKFDEKVDSIFWIMKDDTLPPILKITSSTLASTLGATLATKRSSAEHGVNSSRLVIEPYANPFRLYPLRKDYEKFKDLFENKNVACYVLNTGYFLNLDIPKEVTLGIIEQLVSNKLTFKNFGHLNEIYYTDIEDYNPDLNNEKYVKIFIKRMEARFNYLNGLNNNDSLPDEALQSIRSVINQLKE
ncbi:MAG: phosphoenolpyruvate carboxykinase (ATP) [Candidatus Izimaplasma sp.]|nr:phosphoenolpyruvate carboxykinase (ATP) [Candidatus Izimaplasma bacterium]